jgi:hypothetical protein
MPLAFAAVLSLGAAAMSDRAVAADQTDNLHICNADEITSLPALASDSANDCINNQRDDEMPKALMCSNNSKAFCCTQNIDQIGKCTPIVAGRKRTVPVRDPNAIPKGEPGGYGTMPEEPAPVPDNLQ